MNEKFTWVETHKGIVKFLKDKRNNQNELIQLLKDVGIKENQTTNEDISLTMIDPFTFFCYIYKSQSDEKRLDFLQKIARNINVSNPTDTYGLPSVEPRRVLLFSNIEEINILWNFFEKIISDEDINYEFFPKILQINNIAKPKLTQVMFYINPEKYLPIDGKTIPYLILEKEIDNLEFDSYAQYLEILEAVKSKMPNEKFCKISADAYNWNRENEKNYIYWFVKSEENNINPSNFDVKEWGKITVGQIVLNKEGHIGKITAFTINPYKIIIDWIKKEQTNLNHQKQKDLKLFDLSDLEQVSIIKKINSLIKSNNPNKNSQNKMNMSSLNQILYGPPGTGKTYNTINRALEIIEPDIDFNMSRTELKKKFDKHIKEGRIVFTTFHQSMSYEDFIEGIKPQKSNIEDTFIKYEVEKGIFKQICETAESNYENSKVINKLKLSFDEVFDIFKNEWEEKPKMKFSLMRKGSEFTIFDFSNSSIFFEKSNGSKNHTLSINTLKKIYYGEAFDFDIRGLGNYYKPISEKINELSSKSKKGEIKLNPYVLIIDEINRGNVSAIFGELITLIEESKRLGKPEALTVTLPYSKEPFGVPPNLHIIGTMNTADRSVEALDTALRRRFIFEEMMPNYELLTDKNIDNISLKTILETINNRIEVLLSRDHLIGHSYFLEVDSWEKLQEAFYKNIIPLLQEYFYGDYGKIGLVLGSGFVKKKNIATPFAKVDDYDYDFERNVFEIIKNNTETIKNAINKLLNINDNAQD